MLIKLQIGRLPVETQKRQCKAYRFLDETWRDESKTMLSPDPVFLNAAFDLAKEALSVYEVPIGCIFVFKDQIIGGGRNRVNEAKNPRFHAEILGIDEVYLWAKANNYTSEEVFSQCHLYVTVEPCVMCASALEQLRVPVIFYGCENSRFGGCVSVTNVFKLQNSFQPTIISQCRGEEAIELLKLFYQCENPNAPNPKPKLKKSKDDGERYL